MPSGAVDISLPTNNPVAEQLQHLFTTSHRSIERSRDDSSLLAHQIISLMPERGSTASFSFLFCPADGPMWRA